MPLTMNKKAFVLVPAAFAAAGALVFACSSSEPAPPGGPSGTSPATASPLNEGEPVTPISPQEQAPYNADEVCASQCFVDFAGGAQLLQDLDDCNTEKCYGDDEDDNTAEGSCSAIGSGAAQITYGLVERDRCLARSCCAQAEACSKNAGCTSLASCIERCQAKL